LGEITFNLDGEFVYRDGLACGESTLVLSIGMKLLLVGHSLGRTRAYYDERVRKIRRTNEASALSLVGALNTDSSAVTVLVTSHVPDNFPIWYKPPNINPFDPRSHR
jgi:hypothetical protein